MTEYPTMEFHLVMQDICSVDVIPLLSIPSLGIRPLGILVEHGRNTHYILYLI